ncbi:MAG: CNNM domain-containing protein [Planctomycetota bacterium]
MEPPPAPANVSLTPYLLSLGCLILASGLFSGSEAALFSLRDRDRRRLARGSVANRNVAALLQDSQGLLSAILFWNLLINMIYFAVVAILSSHVERPGLFTVGSLLAIIFFSEMLPKSLAVMSPLAVSHAVAIPMRLAVALVSPMLPSLAWANRLLCRLIWPKMKPEPEIALADIVRAIDLGTGDAALLRRERQAMRSLVNLSQCRVDEVMRPRSTVHVQQQDQAGTLDLLPVRPPGGFVFLSPQRTMPSKDRSLSAQGNDPKATVTEQNHAVDDDDEAIVGAIPLRLLRPSQIDALEDAVEPVLHVPWSAQVSQVFDQLQQEECNVAIVVNEYGAVVGVLSVEDILRRVLADDLHRDDATDLIESIGVDHYRLHGRTGLGVIAQRLNLQLPEERAATVAGHIQRHNERVPRVGDVAPLHPYELVVVEDDTNGVWVEIWRDPNSPSDAT